MTLRDQVTPVCQQIVSNRYPFVRGSSQEVPLGDFAKVFSPGGVLDKFFTQSLAPYADTSKPEWISVSTSIRGAIPAHRPSTAPARPRKTSDRRLPGGEGAYEAMRAR